jgi:hypothetical protein
VTAAAAIALVGIISITLLPAPTPSGAGAPAPASPNSGGSPSQGGGATAGSVAVPFAPLTTGRHHIDVPLYARFRTYVLDGIHPIPDSVAAVRVTFDLPAGWSGNGGTIAKDAESPTALAMSPWTVGGLYRTPCRPSLDEMQDPPLLASVDGLTGAMITWWRGSDLSGPIDWPPQATGWADGSLGGLAGRYLEVTSHRSIAGCDGGQTLLWEDQRGRQRISTVPGELDRLWILDVSRHVILSPEVIASGIYGSDPEMQVLPLVIDATSQPGASPEDLAELQAIVDSIEIEPLASPSASPSSAASPGVTATRTPTASASADSPAIGAGPLAAGRHHIDVHLSSFAGGVFTPGGRARVSFDLPAGWRGEDGWAIVKGDPDSPSGLVMTPVTVHRVYIEPCEWSLGNLADGPLARSLDGLAEALTAWWGVGFAAGPTLPPGAIFDPTLPTATRPARITLAGFEARYVEVRTPSDLDLATCDEGRYVLFSNVDRQRQAQGAGELARLWIVRVAGAEPEAPGGLLVVDAASQPGASPQDLAELQAIVDSIGIELLVPGTALPGVGAPTLSTPPE